MLQLSQQRCLHHTSREAVARCPECALFFCRECITEHDDRVICAGCLRKFAQTESHSTLRLASMTRLLQLGVALAILWGSFYSAGRLLLSMPADFHNGSVWQAGILDKGQP